MSTLAESVGQIKKPWQWIAAGAAILLIWSAVTLPNLRMARPTSQTVAPPAAEYYSPATTRATSTMSPAQAGAMKATPASADARPNAVTYRKIIRTSSLEMVVQHPADVAEKITALAERFGGYLETSDGGGESAATGTLTIRVPAERFEQVLAEIRKLGLRVEGEKVDTQDVTRQYVDQEATLRNLHAEEAQYLTILKQAGTVKDLLAVSEKLSEVRGQIEQQQAEFNALSKQTETVAIAISLRTEAEAQVFGLNWRPGYQMKLALRDGLESVATYATAMTTIVFYLPAMLLWVGTILASILVGVKAVRWSGRRWFGWRPAEATAK
jgi:hypothetical protein